MHYENISSQNANILIVDDDVTLCLLMKDTLATGSYNVSVVRNGFDALDHIKNNRTDMVLLDVTMPEIDGYEVCAEIRRLYGDTNISIIMVTAMDDAESIEKSYTLGATDFISKPINWDTFPSRIHYLIKARDAIVEIKQHKLHLEHIEHVSQIIAQNKNNDIIIQELMLAMLEFFSADKAILLKPDETLEDPFIVDCEAYLNDNEYFNNPDISIIDTLDESTLYQASRLEYPIISRYSSETSPPTSGSILKQQMICGLRMKHTQNWYLIIQQYTEKENWGTLDKESFYKISLRFTNMLSRHQFTEELSRSETLLKQAQKISNLGSWHWSAITNHLTWSDEVYNIYGTTRDTCSPDFKKYFKIKFKEDSERYHLLNTIQNGDTDTYNIEHRIHTQDDKLKWVYEQCTGTYDQTGNLLEINGIVQDITEAHIKKEQEVHNNKMEIIGQITSGVAHDFGNLMTIAKGNLDLLEESLSQDSNISKDLLELLDDTQSAVNDSVNLTKQLLSFSRKKSIAPVYLNIKQTLFRYKPLFTQILGNSISLSINIENHIHDILVDPNQLQSSLLNIIINSKNAISADGRVKITAKETTTSSEGIIRNVNNKLGKRCVCISITDNGTGMNEQVLERAIEPFYTTRTNQGTGLGLSMVYGFIKQSGGELIIRSKPERGTAIHLQFPIYENSTDNKTRALTPVVANSIQITILIVEDHPKVRQFAVRCLTQPNFTILQAENAVDAQELLMSNHVDLLFTDILMPGDIDGNELARWAKKKYPDINILLTTAIEKSTTQKTINKNSIDIQSDRTLNFKMIAKPYSKNKLIEEITGLFKHDTN
jgi:CheY-like chemotaxis protein